MHIIGHAELSSFSNASTYTVSSRSYVQGVKVITKIPLCKFVFLYTNKLVLKYIFVLDL